MNSAGSSVPRSGFATGQHQRIPNEPISNGFLEHRLCSRRSEPFPMNDSHSHLSPRLLRLKQKPAQHRLSFGNSVTMEIQLIFDPNLSVAKFPDDRFLYAGTHKSHSIQVV